jgi:hypothetical protein
MHHALSELREHLRLKGVFALPAVLAGLLCHATARQAPASLVQELGKMTMLSGASAAARAAKFGSSDPLRFPAAGKSLLRAISTPLALALAGMIGLLILLQLANNWRSTRSPVDPDAPTPLLSHGSTMVVSQPQFSPAGRGAVSQKAPSQ